MVECNNKICENCIKGECQTTPKFHVAWFNNKAIVVCEKYWERGIEKWGF